ncbi:hypothetical protein GCM10017744_010220 [Streptomyces antimycoticus]|uniref:Uncharacterized protein n=1 Tax=Streptomyces antimycoticus TaxID=68175 RepID=A0A4D4KP08_9ACTN|nr:hypothetical protein SANT12839_090290 [Streptomyces antimycoticus]
MGGGLGRLVPQAVDGGHDDVDAALLQGREDGSVLRVDLQRRRGDIDDDLDGVVLEPLATRKRTITATQLKGRSGLHGGIALATRDVFGPAGIARLLADEPGADG